MTQPPKKLMWDDPKFSKAYAFFETITGHFASELVQQTDIVNHPHHERLAIFENACGTGIGTAELQKTLASRAPDTFSVTCGDFADTMVDLTRRRIDAAGWTNMSVAKIDGQDTKLPSDHFDLYLTNFGPMVFPDPDAMLSECRRALVPGGMCAFTTWKQVGWMDDMRAAYNTIITPEESLPPFPADDELQGMFNGGRWDDVSFLKDTLGRHGFVGVKVTEAATTMVVHDVEDIVPMLHMMVGQITTRFWTEEQRQRHGGPGLVEALEKWYRDKYAGKSFEWSWSAYMTTCRKPA